MHAWLHPLVVLAGLAQLVLIAASLAIPHVLGWKDQLAVCRPLLRQLFWTYAGYIWGTNLSFGLISTFGAAWLLDGTPLAAAVTGFMFAYWATRLLIQHLVFDLGDAPTGFWPRLAKLALDGLFLALTLIYGLATALNLGLLAA